MDSVDDKLGSDTIDEFHPSSEENTEMSKSRAKTEDKGTCSCKRFIGNRTHKVVGMLFFMINHKICFCLTSKQNTLHDACQERDL